MVGMHIIDRINAAQERAKKLGFVFSRDARGNGFNRTTPDVIALAVIEETLPAIRDGSVVFTGDLEEIESFLAGLEWARWYDTALGLKTNVRRERSEQKMRNRKLLKQIEQGKSQ